MRRGFKSEARKLALELRAELGLDAYGQFDPSALAVEYGIPVFQLNDLGQDPAACAAARLPGAASWRSPPSVKPPATTPSCRRRCAVSARSKVG